MRIPKMSCCMPLLCFIGWRFSSFLWPLVWGACQVTLPRFSSLRVLILWGSPMAPEIVARCREKLPGCQLVQGYGMTETGPGLTMLADAEHVGERLRSCGRPLCGVELEVVDEAGQTLPRGERAASGYVV